MKSVESFALLNEMMRFSGEKIRRELRFEIPESSLVTRSSYDYEMP